MLLPRASLVGQGLACALLAWASAACSDATDGSPVDAGSSSLDLGAGVPDSGAADAGEPDLGELDTGVEPVRTICDDLGLPKRALRPGASTYRFGDVAGDFAVTQTDGTTWRLSEQWTGCESYTFVSYIPLSGSTPTQADRLWSSPVTELLRTSVNAHFFFLSWEQEEGARRARVEALQRRIDDAIAALGLPDVDLEQQRRRFHFVVDAVGAIEGSVGGFIEDYFRFVQNPASAVDLGDRGMAPPPLPFAFAIDRRQEWDEVGSLSEAVGRNFALRMASYAPSFFDHKARLEHQLATESGVDTFVVADETQTRERILIRTVQLPSAQAMAAYDTLEVDVGITCRERNVFACSEWDRIAWIFVCGDEACTQRQELVRWITPYWRRGEHRWIWDASALLALIRQGGARRLLIETGPEWERATPYDMRVALRLSTRGGPRSVGVAPAFTGGRFDVIPAENVDYNAREPITFTPPANARRVEVVAILSGHGQAATTNCAEWCDHRHVFSVDGMELPAIRHLGNIGSATCGVRSNIGVPTGQWGNWAQERAYWCPGLPVEHIRIDITSQVTPGQPFSLDYRANFRGTSPTGGGDIALTSYVVWYE